MGNVPVDKEQYEGWPATLFLVPNGGRAGAMEEEGGEEGEEAARMGGRGMMISMIKEGERR